MNQMRKEDEKVKRKTRLTNPDGAGGEGGIKPG